MSLGHVVSASWKAKQYWLWVLSCEMDLKSDQLLVGYSYRICATFAQAYPADITLLLKEFVISLFLMFLF